MTILGRALIDGVRRQPSAMDGHIVNLVDDAPMTIYEITQVVGATMAPSSAPLTNPFFGHLDGSLARGLGFRPKLRTTYQAIEDAAL